MLKESKLEIEEDLIVLLENDKIKYYTETLSFQVDDLLRRIPTLMEGSVCPNEDGCRCTYEGGCIALKDAGQLLKVGIVVPLTIEETQNNTVESRAYKIVDLD